MNKDMFSSIKFFSQFGLPLTRQEVFWYAWKEKRSIQEIDAHIDTTDIDDYDAFVGIADTVDGRLDHTAISYQFIKKAKQVTGWLRYVPGIRAVYVCNSIALGAATKKSDIDLCIITKTNFVWTTRFFSTLLCKLLRVRTSKRGTAGKICLSFFLDETALDMSRFAIDDDIYLAHWVQSCLPLYFADQDIHDNFISQNTWIDDIFPNHPNNISLPLPWRVSDTQWSRYIRSIGEYICTYMKIHTYVYSFQYRALCKRFVQSKTPYGIRLTPHMIKLHEDDKRKAHRRFVFGR